MTKNEAMQQALVALGEFGYHGSSPRWERAVNDLRTALEQQAETVAMRMPKVGDRIVCLEDESLGKVVSLTAGGSPDILFDDGSHGTYLLHEFAELFGYVASPLPVQEDAFEGWVKIDEVRGHFDSVNCGTIYKHGGEGRVLLRSAPPKREWVGLTGLEQKAPLLLTSRDAVFDTEAKLKERNG